MSKHRQQPYRNLRKLWDTRWTPNTPELRALVQRAVDEAGSQRQLAVALQLSRNNSSRMLRKILNETDPQFQKAVSFRIVDKILCRSDVAHMIRHLPWLTVDELVEQGIWLPQFGPEKKAKAREKR